MSALKSRSHPEAPARLALSFIFPLINCLCVSSMAPSSYASAPSAAVKRGLCVFTSQSSSAPDRLIFTLSLQLSGSTVTISLSCLDSNTLSLGELFLFFFSLRRRGREGTSWMGLKRRSLQEALSALGRQNGFRTVAQVSWQRGDGM